MPPVFVDRQVAGTLHQDLAAAGRGDEVTGAHQRAAEYWQWQAAAWPQDRHADLHDLLEGRHHLHMAGDNDRAGALTEVVCAQLHAWGELDREAALIRETLAWLPPRSPLRAAWIQEIGKIAQVQGNYAEAEQRYRHSLEIFASIGDADGVSRCHHRLGILAQAQGDYAEAERRYQQSLDLLGQSCRQRCGRSGLARCRRAGSRSPAGSQTSWRRRPSRRQTSPRTPRSASDARPDIRAGTRRPPEAVVRSEFPQVTDVRPACAAGARRPGRRPASSRPPSTEAQAPDVPADVPQAADVQRDARQAPDVLPMDPPASDAAPPNVLRYRRRGALRHDRPGRPAARPARTSVAGCAATGPGNCCAGRGLPWLPPAP